jgi:hypothetical protein
MPKNPPDGMPRLMPHLFYRDPSASLDFEGHLWSFAQRVKDVPREELNPPRS